SFRPATRRPRRRCTCHFWTSWDDARGGDRLARRLIQTGDDESERSKNSQNEVRRRKVCADGAGTARAGSAGAEGKGESDTSRRSRGELRAEPDLQHTHGCAPTSAPRARRTPPASVS